MGLSLRTPSIEIQDISDASVSLLILKPPALSHEIILPRPLPQLCTVDAFQSLNPFRIQSFDIISP
jgi:hypothetical protein